MTRRHAIGSLEFELTIARHREAAGVQNRIAALTEHEVPRLIEAVLDRFDRSDRTLQLERIDLDLGRISRDELEHTLAAILEQELCEVLERCTRNAPELDETPIALSLPARTLTDLSFFLRTGFLPWSTDPDHFTDLPAVVEELLNEPSASLGTELRQLFAHRAARLRLIANLPEPLLDRLVAEAIGTVPELLEALHAQLDGADAAWRAATLPRDRKTLHYLPLLRAAARLPCSGVKQPELLRGWLEQAFAPAAQPGVDAVERALEAITEPATESSPGNAAVARLLEQLLRRRPRADPGDGAFGAASDPAEIILMGLPDPTADDERVEAPSWLVRNAGLVLLWPYLPRYFERIGLATDGAFRTHNAARRALHELQYLAVGDRPYREYDLVLNKVLCGVPLDEPTAFDPDYQHDHAAEAEELLVQVIGHWPEVGRMSVDGLRGSFLLRSAKLTRRESAYTLQVERTGFDVLLQGLRHPLSVVQLPWMKEVVFVEW